MASTYNYSRAQATARRLIAKFGNNAATLVRTDINSGTQGTLTTTLCVSQRVTHALGDSGVAIGDMICIFDDRVPPMEGDRIAWGEESGVVMGPVTPLRINGIDTAFFTAPVRSG